MEYQVCLPGMREGSEKLKVAVMALQEEIERCMSVASALAQMTGNDDFVPCIRQIQKELEEEQQALLNMTAVCNRAASIYNETENHLVDQMEEELLPVYVTGKAVDISVEVDQQKAHGLMKQIKL